MIYNVSSSRRRSPLHLLDNSVVAVGPRAIAGEPRSWKGTFRPDSHVDFLSGLRLASPNFPNFVRTSVPSLFFAQFCPDRQDLAFPEPRNHCRRDLGLLECRKTPYLAKYTYTSHLYPTL